MYDERDKNINSQTNSSTKYISNIYGGVMQNEIHVRSQCLKNFYVNRRKIEK